MILRTVARRRFTTMPNHVFTDKRLSLDARGLLGFLLTLPPRWEIRPRVIRAKITPEDGRPIGREKLQRLFGELQATGYMARSAEQGRDPETGYFGSFFYIVGAEPDLVAQEASIANVLFLPQSALPPTVEPKPAEPTAEKIYKDTKHKKGEIPLSPQAICPDDAPHDFRSNTTRGLTEKPSSILDGEILPPQQPPTFNEFWEACVTDIRNTPGRSGPAIAAWRKLDDNDQRAIGSLIADSGTIDLDGMWAAVWLRERRWEAAKLKRASVTPEFFSRPIYRTAEPYSHEWNAIRANRIAAGESVALMDEWAKRGKGWSYEVKGEASNE